MKKWHILIILFLLLFLSSCSNYVVRYEYDVEQIDKIEKSNLEMTYFGGLKTHYIDNELELFFDFKVVRIPFQVNNNSNDTLYMNLGNIKVESDSLEISIISENLSEIPKSPYKLLDSFKEPDKIDDSLKTKIAALFIIKIPPKESYSDLLLLKYSRREQELIQSDIINLINIAKRTVGTEYKLLFPFRVGQQEKELIFLVKVNDYNVLNKG